MEREQNVRNDSYMHTCHREIVERKMSESDARDRERERDALVTVKMKVEAGQLFGLELQQLLLLLLLFLMS